MKTILWDWNGTLLDDVEVSHSCLNDMLRRYGRPEVPTADAYRAIFGFPVRDYYARAGIGDDLFDEVAPLWMAAYMEREITCGLRPDARAALTAFRQAGYRQVILSASKRENLLHQMERFDILPFFDDVLGLSHIYATSKEGIGREWMERAAARPQDCVMIGDTLHDAEVAAALGCRCVLVCGGHQLPAALRSAGCPVADSLADAARQVLENGKDGSAERRSLQKKPIL